MVQAIVLPKHSGTLESLGLALQCIFSMINTYIATGHKYVPMHDCVCIVWVL